MDKKRFPKPKPPSHRVPEPLKELALDRIDLPFDAAVTDLYHYNYSHEERVAVQQSTVDQASSQIWFRFREGMITASKVKRLITRMATIEKAPNTDTACLVSEIMGYNKKVDTKDMKYGRAQELHAKTLFQKLQRKRHKRFTQKDSGLCIHQDFIFIGASPDLVVSCACHENGLCEIKCPASIKSESPSHENLAYLELSSDTQTHLNRTHEYYYQIQAQMGVCGYSYCYFFVYTFHGYHLEKIEFDSSFWSNMLTKMTGFWRAHVAPELLTQKLWLAKVQSVEEPQHTCIDKQDHIYMKTVMPPRKVAKTYKPIPDTCIPIIYMCGVCHSDGTTNVVECCDCKVWYHFNCVNIKPGEEPGDKDSWLCKCCKSM